MQPFGDIEEFLKPYGNQIGVAGIVLSLAVSVYFWLRPRSAPPTRFEKEKAEHEKEIMERLLHAAEEDRARLHVELEAARSATFEDRRARQEAAAEAIRREAKFAPELLKKVRRAVSRNKDKEAEELFLSVLEDEPEFAAEANYHLGLFAENRDFAAAETYYRKAIDLEPENALYLAAAGELAVRLKRFDDADGWLAKALDRMSGSSVAERVLRGRILTGLGAVRRSQSKYVEAEALDREAVGIRASALGSEHPDTARSLHNLGYDCYGQQRYSEAEECHRRALATREKALGLEHPETADTIHKLGLDCHSQGRHPKTQSAGTA